MSIILAIEGELIDINKEFKKIIIEIDENTYQKIVKHCIAGKLPVWGNIGKRRCNINLPKGKYQMDWTPLFLSKMNVNMKVKVGVRKYQFVHKGQKIYGTSLSFKELINDDAKDMIKSN